MLVSVCPHCQTQHCVKESRLNVAQGFVMCSHCEGLFQARSHVIETPSNSEDLPSAITDVKLVHQIGSPIRVHKSFTKQEIVALFG